MKSNAKSTYMWQVFFFGLILILLALNVKYFSVSGHDFRIYTAAAEAYRQGLDPYLVRNIARYSGTELSFAYPPLALLFFGVALHINNMHFYVAIWSLMIASAFFIARAADDGPDTLFLARYSSRASEPRTGTSQPATWT